MKNKIFITGKSVICSSGDNTDQIISQIQNRKYHTDEVSLKLADSEYKRPYYRIHSDKIRKKDNVEKYFYDILFYTIAEAIEDASLKKNEIRNLSLFLGSTSIDIPVYEEYYEKSENGRSNIFTQVSSGYGNIAMKIADEFNIAGPCYTFVTACTSSANAMIYAASMIQQGMTEKALVVGYDLFNKTGLYGFEALKLISPSYYKPFSKNRDGIIMGEGCGALILDKKRKSDKDFYYLGGSTCCDTFNITTHDIKGDGIAKVINEAISNAELATDKIDAIKAHATGSYQNDKTECNGIKSVFGNHIPPVTGIKPFIGHTVGASGVIESIIITESVKRGFFPATSGFEEYDEELGIKPVTDNYPIEQGSFLMNFFGFGGNCSCMILSNED